MALTYGFYDSLNHDRVYSANQMSTIFNGIITDGVFQNIGEHFSVIAGTGMQVIVKPGRAWFDGTWTLLDTDYALSINASNALLSRIDAVVLETNFDVETRANSIKVVAGTPSTTPVAPTLESGDLVNQHVLAYVNVAAGATAITNSMIDIQVGVNKETPYITSVLQQTNITELYLKWEDEWYDWFNNVKTTLSGDVAANLQANIDALENDLFDIGNYHLWRKCEYTVGEAISPEVFVPETALSLTSSYGIFAGTGYSDTNMYTYEIPLSKVPMYLLSKERRSELAAYIRTNYTARSYDDFDEITCLRNSSAITPMILMFDAPIYRYTTLSSSLEYCSYHPTIVYARRPSTDTNSYSLITTSLASGSAIRTVSANTLKTSSYISSGDYEAVAEDLSYSQYSSSSRLYTMRPAYYGSSTSSYTTITWLYEFDTDVLSDPTSGTNNTTYYISKSKSAYSEYVVTGGTPASVSFSTGDPYLLSSNGISPFSAQSNMIFKVYTDYELQDSNIVPRGDLILETMIPSKALDNELYETTTCYIFTYAYRVPGGDNTSYFRLPVIRVHGAPLTYYGTNGYELHSNLFETMTVIPASVGGTTSVQEYIGKLGDIGPVECGSYIGTGTYGSDYPNRITFTHRPDTLIIYQMAVVDDDRLICQTLLDGTIIKPMTDLKDCPSVYTAGYGLSVDDALAYGAFDAGSNTFYWYTENGEYSQFNSTLITYSGVESSTLKNIPQYFWVAFG